MYEPVEDTEDAGRVSYIKMYNVGQKMATRYCNGYLPSEVRGAFGSLVWWVCGFWLVLICVAFGWVWSGGVYVWQR